MTNDEIRALVDEAKADLVFCEEHIKSLPMYDFKMTMRLTSAVKTLLARQAEVLSQCPKDSTCCAGMCRLSRIRAILDPQEQPTAKPALAKEMP